MNKKSFDEEEFYCQTAELSDTLDKIGDLLTKEETSVEMTIVIGRALEDFIRAYAETHHHKLDEKLINRLYRKVKKITEKFFQEESK